MLDFRLPLPTNLPGGENFIQPTADYRDSNVSRRQATRALAKAGEFVGQIKKEIFNG
jgi:hypothetical protein